MAKRTEIPRAASPVSNAVAAVVLIGVIAAVVYIATNWSQLTTGFQDAVAEIPELAAERAQQAASGSESLLLLVLDESQGIGSMALAAAADDEPASFTLIPVTLYELLPGYGDFPIGEAVVFEGPELARVAVANALGVRIDRVATIPAGHLASLGDVDLVVDLSEPVIAEEGTLEIGRTGPAQYSAELVEQLLVNQFESSPVAWLDRQAAVWQALLQRVGEVPTLADGLLGEGAAATALGRVAGRDPQVSIVPAAPVAVAGANDGFQLTQADVAEFVQDRIRHLALASGLRPRAEVLNGNGEILATRSVVAALVGAGFHVVKTDNADNFEFEETVVISQGRANRDAATRAAAVLGVRMVQLEVVAPSGVVDVSIIVGQDIATLRS